MKKEESSEMARDWASIPGDLFIKITEKAADSIEDYVRFGAVCRWWHCSLNNDKPKVLPWLMLTEKQGSDMRGFYNLATDKVYEIELPEIRGRKCWGSLFGWLITVGIDLEIHLFNPLSRARLSLPSQFTFTSLHPRYFLSSEECRDGFCYKILLSSNPSSSDCIAMAIYSCFFKLAFAKSGDHAWRPIQFEKGFDDMIHFGGNFFAVKNGGNLFICEDLYGDHPVAVEFAAPPPGKSGLKKYLVDLGGNLCMVCRSNVHIIGGTFFFLIHILGIFIIGKKLMSLGRRMIL